MNQNANYLRSIPLSDLRPGEAAQIFYIDPSNPLSERLCDLGIQTGAYITCERIAFLGDPAAYRLADTNTVIALRRSNACQMMVLPIESYDDSFVDTEGGRAYEI